MKHRVVCITLFCLFGALSISAMPLRAATLSFTPTGAQLDGDDIKDIATAVGNVISFNVYIDTVGLEGPLQSFSYQATWDNSELTLNAGSPVPSGNFPGSSPYMTSQTVGTTTVSTISHVNGNIAANTPTFLLDTWRFTVAKGLTNDGVSDFRVVVSGAMSTVNGQLKDQQDSFRTSLPNGVKTNGFQQVEVQPAAVPEPGLFAMLGAGLGVLWMRRRSNWPSFIGTRSRSSTR